MSIDDVEAVMKKIRSESVEIRDGETADEYKARLVEHYSALVAELEGATVEYVDGNSEIFEKIKLHVSDEIYQMLIKEDGVLIDLSKDSPVSDIAEAVLKGMIDS